MKEKKIGDEIIFDYDVYEIENNVELLYDHTDTLKGIVTGVRKDYWRGHITYEVKLIGIIDAERPRYYDFDLDSNIATFEVDGKNVRKD